MIKREEYSTIINQLKMGDQSGVEEEVKKQISENDWLAYYLHIEGDMTRHIRLIQDQIEDNTKEIKNTPNDLLPTYIHAELMDIHELEHIELELEKYKSLLIKVEQEIKRNH